jgi:hypothetical protein
MAAAAFGAGYGSARKELSMLRELVLAIGIPLVVLLLGVLALEQWRDQLPAWLQRLAERPSWLWNTGIGLIIGLSLLRWLLQR